MGSYIGLVFLGAVFTAIGIWCSSFTPNAVVAFIVAALTCFLLYSGFGAISTLPVFAAGPDYYIGALGIDFHYRSISRGVIDTRDVLYFLSVIFLFLFLTSRHLARRSQGPASPAANLRRPEGEDRTHRAGKSRWAGNVIIALMLLVLVGLNLLAALVHYRLDLTADKRYTLSAPTKAMLARLDEDVQVDFFLEGNLKAGIRKLSESSLEMLQNFDEYCGGKIRVHAFDPLANLDDLRSRPSSIPWDIWVSSQKRRWRS